MGNTLPKLHQVNKIAYNNGPKTIHGRTITSSNAYHKATGVVPPPHEWPDLIQRYTQNLDTLELNILITFLLFITIGEVCVFKSETSLLRCEQCDRVKTSFSFW
jgi:hypothetical protein